MQSKLSDERIFIGLGSNIGDGLANLAQGVTLIEKRLNKQTVRSGVYRSEPVGFDQQPWFYNQVIYIDHINLGPLELLSLLKEIEQEMGRTPSFRYGPRLIDLDLIFYKDWVLESSFLSIPHPKLYERSFVLFPLIDIAPEKIDPRTGLYLKQVVQLNRKILKVADKIG